VPENGGKSGRDYNLRVFVDYDTLKEGGAAMAGPEMGMMSAEIEGGAVVAAARAAFSRDLLADLERMAREDGQAFLAHLIHLARIEADGLAGTTVAH